jgi:chemotaxis-related protein WspB
VLYLLFRLGTDRYALRTEAIVEVLPLITWRQLPQVPPDIRGIIDYHGVAVPVLDLQSLALGTPVELRMAARIVVVDYPGGDGERRLLGLLVQEATGFIRRGEEEFTDSPVRSGAPYAGPITLHETQMVQRVELEQMVSPDLWRRFFRDEG